MTRYLPILLTLSLVSLACSGPESPEESDSQAWQLPGEEASYPEPAPEDTESDDREAAFTSSSHPEEDPFEGLDDLLEDSWGDLVEPLTDEEHRAETGSGRAREMEALHVGGDVQRPRLIHQHPVQLTEQARLAKAKGLVIAQLIIDIDGQVASVKILKGVPAYGITESAERALWHYQFEPARLHGQAVAVYWNTTVEIGAD